MTASSNHLNFEQLIALVEAGKFPIGVSCADPMTARLYDAWTKLMCHSSRAGRQASIAYRHIDSAMSDMGNNQGGYYHLKKCLEEMKAQDTNETADVVLCRQYHEELNDVIPAAKATVTDLRAIADRIKDIAPYATSEVIGVEAAHDFNQGLNQMIAVLRGSADVLTALMDFAGDGPQVQKDVHALNTAPVGSERFFNAIEALLGTVRKIEFCAGGYIVELEHGQGAVALGQALDVFRMSIEGVQVLESSVPFGSLEGSNKPQLLAQHLGFMDELKLQIGRLLEPDEGAQS
ncbi:hypothetical protein [Aeromonas enteropelogenes]|uniref:hypothetical protein n=1 Tax=Aeromonas enteropelogenes TaxID=29489 RepID=UPI003BA1C554